MSHICRFTVPASRDIEYVADNSSFDTAERLLNQINNQCKRLATPSMGRKRDELAPNVQSFPINNYLIFYRDIESGIEVLRVVSGYRDLRNLFLQQDED